MRSESELDARLIEAHSSRNLREIASHYALAADRAEMNEDIDRACFFLTHAWIFALEAGDLIADDHRSRLAAYGRV